MEEFHGRRGPNVSQYIANLNAIPSPHDMATQQQQQQQEGFDLNDALAVFTNTTFFDFEKGEHVDLTQVPGYSPEDKPSDMRGPSSDDLKNVDYLNGDYPYPDFNFHHGAGGVLDPNGAGALAAGQSAADGSSAAGAFASQAFGLPGDHAGGITLPPQEPVSGNSSTTTGASPQIGEKRGFESTDLTQDSGKTHGSSSSVQSLEESSRVAAEEDKRRRNTAASARFRVKKKQREQTLERTAKEMSEKASTLESRISQLEMENQWLKNLITEKNTNTGPSASPDTKEDVLAAWKRYEAENKDKVELNKSHQPARADKARSLSSRKDGVGTKTEKK